METGDVQTTRMSYREIAAAFSLGSPDSARIKAKRAGWRIIPGNHPLDPVFVEVPTDLIPSSPPPNRVPANDTPPPPPKSRPPLPNPEDIQNEGWRAALAAYSEQVDRLSAMLDAERAERTRLIDLLQEGTEAVVRAQTEADDMRSERDAARAQLSELKALTAMLVEKVADEAKKEAENVRSEVETLRRETGKTLIGMQKLFR